MGWSIFRVNRVFRVSWSKIRITRINFGYRGLEPVLGFRFFGLEFFRFGLGFFGFRLQVSGFFPVIVKAPNPLGGWGGSPCARRGPAFPALVRVGRGTSATGLSSTSGWSRMRAPRPVRPRGGESHLAPVAPALDAPCRVRRWPAGRASLARSGLRHTVSSKKCGSFTMHFSFFRNPSSMVEDSVWQEGTLKF